MRRYRLQAGKVGTFFAAYPAHVLMPDDVLPAATLPEPFIIRHPCPFIPAIGPTLDVTEAYGKEARRNIVPATARGFQNVITADSRHDFLHMASIVLFQIISR